MNLELLKQNKQSFEMVKKLSMPGQDTAFNIFFENGYGASVVRGLGTYGGNGGLYELAVIEGNKEDWDLTYDTPVTNDVIGYLTEADVIKHLFEIQALGHE